MTLADSGRSLWFKPDVVTALADRRAGSLGWYTRDTGSVSCSPDCAVHFGINQLGLVNVFAEDVVLLPEWQQQIWAGHNVGPEGGVSEELLASQVRARPAETQVLEEFFTEGLEAGAEAALTQSLADGTAYFNIHTALFVPRTEGRRLGAEAPHRA